MTIEAKIICDSINPDGIRLTTYVVTFPRFILPEFNTHRMFSRNGASSRAIPVSKQIEKIEQYPFTPEAFNKNSKGMQGAEVVDSSTQLEAELIWLEARNACIDSARKLANLGIAKQYANRLLEPFNFTTMIVSATEYSNFFALRHHSAAQPEMQKLAEIMWELYKTNEPVPLKVGEWHLPFVTEEEIADHHIHCATMEFPGDFEHAWLPLIKMSVARCARVSYLNHEGKQPSQEEDFKLYDRLLGSQPIHASSAEHQAKCVNWGKGCWSGNFQGWEQYRKTLENENIETFEGPLG